MAIYLKLGDIKGNVTADGYADHIGIDSFSFGVGRAISMEAGRTANREASRPNVSEVTISKMADNSVNSLFKESTVGSKGLEAIFKFVRTGADKLDEYMTITLKNALVSSYSLSAGGDGAPMESVSFSYTEIEVSYKDSDAKNASSGPARVLYNLELGKGG